MSHALHSFSLRTALLCFTLAVATGCHHHAAQPSDGGVDAGSDGGSDAGDGGGGSDAGPSDGGSPDGGDGGVAIVINSIFPSEGPIAGGTNLLINGSGFVDGFATSGGGAVSARTQVRVGGALATNVNVIDDNRLFATTPAGAPGAADLEIDNPNGSGICSGCYRYLAHVVIDSVEPAAGPSRGGTAVTVHGSGFDAELAVTFAGAPLVQLAVVDAHTATGIAPPGALGPATVAAITRDGRASLPGAFTYRDPLTLSDVQPRLVPTAGGTALALSGQGFTAQAALSIDGQPVASYWIDAEHLGLLSPAHAAGAVDVTVTDPGALALNGGTPSATLARGLVYGDPASTLPGPLALSSLWPTHGPLAGGTCPAACLHLAGAGFTQGDLVVALGGTVVDPASIHIASDQLLSLDLPVGAQAGAIAVSVASASQSSADTIPASDPGAFHYDALLSLASVSPATAPASAAPAVSVTLNGIGFNLSPGAPLVVRIGALDATNVQIASDGNSLTALAPAGAAGLADVEVIATDADGWQRHALLPAAFTFVAPLSLLSVSPSSGARSGGARVSLYGRGFTAGLSAKFGSAAATNVQILSSSEATCTIPAGAPGAVNVTATLGAASDTLSAGFTYFNPGSNSGGTSGPVLQGTLNVTVLDERGAGGVAGALVAVSLSDGTNLHATTDSNGQFTFADPRLVLTSTVTASKPTYNTITVEGVAVENLTVYLLGPAPVVPPPPPPPADAGPPPPPETATISGHVYGFKIPPTITLNANQRIVAYVRETSGSIYGGAPFQPPGTPLIVAHDGDGFGFTTANLSPFALYAELGVETTTGTDLYTFAPFLLGVLRGVQPNPHAPVTNADIILDTHLDQTVTAQVLSPPDPGAGNTLLHQAAVDLDLGSAGIIPLSSTQTTASSFDFTALPAAEGQGFVFIDEVTNGMATSIYLRRIFSDVGQGVTLGPYLPFPLLQAPVAGGPAFDGTFRWTMSEGLAPNLIQLRLDNALPDGTDINWTVVLPGTVRAVTIPDAVRAQLLAGSTANWTVTCSYAPGFNFDFWNYNDLYSTGWITYAYGFGQFTVPP